MADAFSELKAELTLDESGLDRGVSKAESSLGGLSTAMAGAGVGAAALGGAIVGKSIQAFGSFDQALTQSTAIMGDVSDSMKDKLGKTARDTAAQLGISSDKAAESYYFLASAGLDASESMEAMPAVAQFAAAGQIDMAEATDYATDVMKAFQIPTKNMTRVTDAMTASVTRHNSTMEGMGEAMSYVAPVAKGLGLSVEETSAAIGFLGDAGIKGSKAGTTLRQALAKLSNPTKGMQKKLKELGVSVTGSGGKMRNFSDILADLKSAGATTADVMELFGTRAGPGMQVLLSEGGKAIAKEAKKIKSMGGITKEVAEKQLQTLNKQVDIFKTKLQNAAISIGGYFAPSLTRILKLAGGAVDWFSKLNEKTDGLAGAMSAASLVVGGLALAVGTLVGGPLVGLVAGIAGVVAVVGTMTGRFDGAIASIKSVASSLSSLFAPAVKTAMRAARAAVSGNLTKFASLARKAFGQFQTAVKTGLGRAWSWVKTEGVAAAKGAVTALGSQAVAAFSFSKKNILPKVRTAITSAWTWVTSSGVRIGKSALKGLGTAAIAAFTFTKEKILPPIQRAVKAGWNWIKTSGVSLGKTALGKLGTAALTAFKFTKKNILPKVKTAIKAGWTWLRTKGLELGKKALGALVTGALAGWTWTRENVVPPVKTGLSKAWTWLKNDGVSLAKGALSALVTGALKGWTWTRENVVPPLKTGFGKAWSWAKSDGVTAGKNALDSLAAGILVAWKFTREDVVPAVKTGLGRAWTWLRNDGVAAGKKAVGFLAKQAVTAFDLLKGGGKGGGLKGKARTGVRGLNQYIRGEGATSTKGAFGRLVTKATEGFGDLSAKITEKTRTAVRNAKEWVVANGPRLFKGAFRALGRAAGETLATELEGVQTAFKTALPKIRDWLRANGKDIIRNGFKAIGKGIRTAVLGMLAIGGIVGQAFVSTVNGLRDWLKDGGATRLKNGFIGIVSGIVSYLKNDAFGDLKGAAEFLFGAVMAAAEGLYQGLIGGSLIPDMMGDIASFIRNFDLVGAFDSILKAAWKRFDKFTTDSWNAIKHGLADILGSVRSWKLFGAVDRVLSSVWKRFSKLKRDATNTIKTTLSDIVKKVTSWSLYDKVDSALSSVWKRFSKLKTDATNTMKNLVSGILDAVSPKNLKKKLKSKIGGALDGAKKKFESLYNDVVGNSIVPDMASEVVGVMDAMDMAGPTTREMARTFNQFAWLQANAKKRTRKMSGETVRTIDAMARATTARAKSWVGSFVNPFAAAKDRVSGLFSRLHRMVVGGSIVPDMLSDLVSHARGSWARRFVAPFKNAADRIASRLGRLRQEAAAAARDTAQSAARAAKAVGKAFGGGKSHADRRIDQLVKAGKIGRGIDWGGLKNAYFSKIPRSLQGSAFDFVGEALDEHGKAAGMRAINWLAKHPNTKTYPYGKFASGGIVTGPTNALIGEAGPEAVIPLSKLDSMVTPAGGGSKEVHHHHETTVIKLDGDKTAELWRGEAVEVADERERRRDRSLNRVAPGGGS